MKWRGPRETWLALILLAVGLASVACDKAPAPYKASRLLMGTLVEITVVGHPDKARSAAEAAFEEIKRVERLTSFHQPSALTSLNEQAGFGPVKTDPELARLVEASLKIAAQTGGAFDPTVGPLSRLWGFSGTTEPRLPTQAEIDSALSKVGWKHVRVDRSASTVDLPESGMSLDLGGIAKGYALNRAAAVLKEMGIRSALVNAGGDIIAIGEKSSGRPWRIGVQDPRDQKGILAVVELKDRAIVTSGDYERVFFINDERYHHILDPKTGYPARGMQSVTIVFSDAVIVDGLSVAVFVAGPQKGMEMIQSVPGAAGLLVDAAGELHLSPGAASLFELKR
ncbi:MAG: FAD:protein FMN transferase [Thermodesulfobacteriota bacterium]